MKIENFFSTLKKISNIKFLSILRPLIAHSLPARCLMSQQSSYAHPRRRVTCLVSGISICGQQDFKVRGRKSPCINTKEMSEHYPNGKGRRRRSDGIRHSSRSNPEELVCWW